MLHIETSVPRLLSEVAGLSLLLVVVKVLHRRYFHKLSKYPGPWLASVTDLWMFCSFYQGQHHLVDKKLHDKYGPVVRVAPNRLLFAELSAHLAIYGTQKSMEKGPYHPPENANLLQIQGDKQHREKKSKVVSPALTSSRIAEYEGIISKAIVILAQNLDRQRMADTTINVAPFCHRLTADIMCEMAFGVPMHFQDGDRDDVLEFRNQVFRFSLMIPLVPWFGKIFSSRIVTKLTRKRTVDKHGNPTRFNAFIQPSRKAVDGALEKGECLGPSMLNNFLKVPFEDKKRMGPDEMWRENFNLAIAGIGSSAAGLTVILYNLALHPEWQTRILNEVEARVDHLSSPTASEPVIPYASVADVPSLQAVMKETLRLSPPVALGGPRYIASGAESAIPSLDAPLPVGTMVGSNVYVICHSKKIWGEDVEEWKPERWLSGEKTGADLPWVVFGRGSRACVGKDIVWMILKKTIVTLLATWELSTLPGSLEGRNNGDMQYSQMMLGFRPRKHGSEKGMNGDTATATLHGEPQATC